MLDSNSWVSSVVVHRFKNMFLSSLTTIWQFFLIPTFHSIILPSLLQTHVKALEEATAAVSRTGYLLNIIRKILLPRPAPRWVHPPSYGHVACGSSLAKIGCQNRRRAEKGRRGEGSLNPNFLFFWKIFDLLRDRLTLGTCTLNIMPQLTALQCIFAIFFDAWIEFVGRQIWPGHFSTNTKWLKSRVKIWTVASVSCGKMDIALWGEMKKGFFEFEDYMMHLFSMSSFNSVVYTIS